MRQLQLLWSIGGIYMKQIQALFLMLALVVVTSLSLTACKKWWGKDEDDNDPFKGLTCEQLIADFAIKTP